MKIASFIHHNQQGYGIVAGDAVYDLTHYAETLKQAIKLDLLRTFVDISLTELEAIPVAEVTWLPVIPDPGKIFCIGINYATHLKETGREKPTHPMIFTRFADSQTAHQSSIIRPAVSHMLDFEGELAVIIGKGGRMIPREEALSHVAGYACYNDGSVRDWQKHTIQFIPGKNFPNTGAFGPWMVTSDELPDPAGLSLTTRLNGEVMQHTTTDDMIFDVPALINYCSTFTPLFPGDVIVTGTTGGVGAFRNPPVWMQPGDRVEVEIVGIGTLENTIADEDKGSA